MNSTAKQVMAFHGCTDKELHFSPGTYPRWAVAYGYCRDHCLLSWLFKLLRTIGEEEIYKDLPMEYGKVSVCCGDWMARRSDV